MNTGKIATDRRYLAIVPFVLAPIADGPEPVNGKPLAKDGTIARTTGNPRSMAE